MKMIQLALRRMVVLLCAFGACLAGANAAPGSATAIEPCIFPQPPPVISLAPHASTNLSVTVVLGSQLSCQWSLNGLPIAGATGTNLAISDFDASKAGIYAIAVTNPYGSATATTVLRLHHSPLVLVDGASVGGGAVTRTNTAAIALSSTFGPDAAIYYTLDGSAPDFTGTPYGGVFKLANSATLRAIAYNFAHTNWAEAAPVQVELWPAYPLTVTTSGQGSVSVAPAPYTATNCYPSNSIVTLTATPANGWGFMGWTGDSTAAAGVTTVVMDRSHELQAVFQRFPLVARTRGGGTISVSPALPNGSNVYAGMTLTTLTATPHTGWSFIRWTGDSTDTTVATKVLMDQPRNVEAIFGASLNLFTNGSGEVLVDPPTGPYPFGSTVQLTPQPSPGYEFFGWANAASGKANPLNFIVTTVPNITALFAVPKLNQAALTEPPSTDSPAQATPAEMVEPAATVPDTNPPSDSAQSVEESQKLTPLQTAQRIKIPEITYHGLPLSEVLINLNDEAIKRDPEGKGVKITLAASAQAKAGTVIALKLNDVTLAQALGKIAQKAKLHLDATDTELILAPAPASRD